MPYCSRCLRPYLLEWILISFFTLLNINKTVFGKRKGSQKVNKMQSDSSASCFLYIINSSWLGWPKLQDGHFNFVRSNSQIHQRSKTPFEDRTKKWFPGKFGPTFIPRVRSESCFISNWLGSDLTFMESVKIQYKKSAANNINVQKIYCEINRTTNE